MGNATTRDNEGQENHLAVMLGCSLSHSSARWPCNFSHKITVFITCILHLRNFSASACFLLHYLVLFLHTDLLACLERKKSKQKPCSGYATGGGRVGITAKFSVLLLWLVTPRCFPEQPFSKRHRHIAQKPCVACLCYLLLKTIKR